MSKQNNSETQTQNTRNKKEDAQLNWVKHYAFRKMKFSEHYLFTTT